MSQTESADGPKEDPYIGVRTEIARVLGPAAFPGNKAHLIEVATQNGADDDILTMLNNIDDDAATFNTTQEVVDAVPTTRVTPEG